MAAGKLSLYQPQARLQEDRGAGRRTRDRRNARALARLAPPHLRGSSRQLSFRLRSRIAAHYATDVLASFAMGAALEYAMRRLLRPSIT
jgi:hypothetical protein